MMKKELWFDMDGTLANLKGINGWLDYLHAEDTYPYENAQPLLNLSLLAHLLNQLQAQGWKIGIISWTSKNGSDIFNGEVALVKVVWLHRHLKSVKWDKINIVEYGTNKYKKCGGGILFDDELENREEWKDIAYTPENILPVLKALRKS